MCFKCYFDSEDAIFDEVDVELDQAVKVRIGDVWDYVNEEGKFTEDGDEAFFFVEFEMFNNLSL